MSLARLIQSCSNTKVSSIWTPKTPKNSNARSRDGLLFPPLWVFPRRRLKNSWTEECVDQYEQDDDYQCGHENPEIAEIGCGFRLLFDARCSPLFLLAYVGRGNGTGSSYVSHPCVSCLSSPKGFSEAGLYPLPFRSTHQDH